MLAGKTIAIIGGGASGALLAYQLARLAVRARIVIIDPSQHPALGLAYSTPSIRHLLNVAAGGMSALPDQPDHFLNWLRVNYASHATEATFAPRSVFGDYLQSLYAKASVEHLQTRAIHYAPASRGGLLTFADGQRLAADFIVLATGNFDPAPLPGIDAAVQKSGLYRHNAWDKETFEGLSPNADVALIGTGLTAVDVLLRLRELGHRGVINAISRNGFLPHRHELHEKLDHCALPSDLPPRVLAYFRAFRQALREGLPWRSVVDSLRSRTNALWLALPVSEQKRFRRHLQRRWDVARHRMAPSIADVIEAERAADGFVICHGHIERIVSDHGMGKILVRNKGAADWLFTDRVINCTGPDLNYRRVASPLLNGLLEQGMAVAGPLGAGFKIDGNGALYDRDDNISETLFTIGPARQGTLFESIAIPEIRQQAADLALHLTECI